MHGISRLYKILGATWIISLLFVICVSIVFTISMIDSVSSITLTVGEKQSLTVIRPIPQQLQISVLIKGLPKEKYKYVGSFKPPQPWSKDKHWHHTGLLKFEDPGEPIKLLITHGSHEVIYESMPGSSKLNNIRRRTLRKFVPYIDDGDPSSFTWPNSFEKPINLISGTNKFSIEIIEMGSKLSGYEGEIRVLSPISYKRISPGYRIISSFFVWSFLLFIILLVGVIILRRFTKHMNAPPKGCKQHVGLGEV